MLEYINFGSSGMKVSPIALGLGLRGQNSAQEAQYLIEHAIDAGINLIDCANVMVQVTIEEKGVHPRRSCLMYLSRSEMNQW